MINSNITRVFSDIKNDVQKTYFSLNANIENINEEFVLFLFRTIKENSILLIDDLMINLNKKSRKTLDNEEPKIINFFYDYQIDEKLKERYSKSLSKKEIDIASDKKMAKQRAIATSSIIFLSGMVLNFVLADSNLAKTFGGTILGIISYAVYKKTHALSTTNALNNILEKVMLLIDEYQQNLTRTLSKMEKDYNRLFEEFCKKYSVNIND